MFKATMNESLLKKLRLLFENPIVITSKEILQEAKQLSPKADKTLERYIKKWNLTM
jgi:hypothetical protein